MTKRVFPENMPIYRQIANNIKQAINDGSLCANSRLPSAREMADQWNVSYITAHKALSVLAQEGFIERFSQRGSFVRGSLPFVVGIICGPNLSGETAYFYRRIVSLLQQELRRRVPDREVSLLHNCSCRLYDGVSSSHDVAVSPKIALSRMKEDMEAYSFGGLIAVNTDLDSLELDERTMKLPTVNVMTKKNNEVGPDLHEFPVAAVDWLHEKGCRNVTLLCKETSINRENYIKTIQEKAWQKDMPSPQCRFYPYSWPCDGADVEKSAHESMRRWLAEWQATSALPDGLIVDDDIAMRGIGLALMEQGGIAVPEIVVLANEGIDFYYGIPVMRYEIPLTELAVSAVDMLSRKISGNSRKNEQILLSGNIRTEGM